MEQKNQALRRETRGAKKKYLRNRERKVALYHQQRKWRNENTMNVSFRLNIYGDFDILEKLAQVPNKSVYLRQLVKDDIEKSKEEK